MANFVLPILLLTVVVGVTFAGLAMRRLDKGTEGEPPKPVKPRRYR